MSVPDFLEKNIEQTVPEPIQQEAHSAKSFLEKSKDFFSRNYKHIFALMAAGGLGYTAYQARDEVKDTLRDVSETVLGKREEPLSPEHKKYVELLEAGNTEEFHRLYNAECLMKQKKSFHLPKELTSRYNSFLFVKMATHSIHAGELDEAKKFLDLAMSSWATEKIDVRDMSIAGQLAQVHFVRGLYFMKKTKWSDAVGAFTESLTHESDIETKSYIDFCLAQMNQAPSKDALSRLAPEELVQNIATRSEMYNNNNSIQPPSLTDFYAQQVKFEQERRLEYLRAAQKRISDHANTGKSSKISGQSSGD